MPWKFATPDPIVQNHYPLLGPDYGKVPSVDKQPWIAWMVRLANAAELHGKSVELLLYIGALIWGGQSDFWPADIPEAFNKTGLDYDQIIADIREDPGKYDALWQANQKRAHESGHGGVPNMIFRAEPYFGQDRFDHLYYRLRQNGLTKREAPIPPLVTKPLRWPAHD